MSFPRGIDNSEESDVFEDGSSTIQHIRGPYPFAIEPDESSPEGSGSASTGNGKGKSRALRIVPSSSSRDNVHDVFDEPTSPSNQFNYSLPSRHPSQPPTPSDEKGKGRELPPSLPPFSFSPSEFGYGQVDWPSSPGPSSYGSPPRAYEHTPGTSLPIAELQRAAASEAVASRRGTDPTPVLAFNEASSSLEPSTRGSHTRANSTPLADPSGHSLAQWSAEETSSNQPTILSAMNISLHAESQRLDSPPFTFSPLDIIPSSSSQDAFMCIHIITRNYFDEILPREIRIHVLLALIELHERDHARAVLGESWSASRANQERNRWVGKDRAIRELLKFARVSKAWNDLIFDGQLWAALDLGSFPKMPSALLLRFGAKAGAFVKRIDLSGHTLLTSSTLITLINDICRRPSLISWAPQTQLTHIDLKGCTSLTNRALQHLVMRCPALESICLKGSSAMNNHVCSLLAVHCLKLVALDVGRCVNMDAEGIRSMAAATLLRGEYLALKELCLSGLKGANDVMMRTLGRAAPWLEVLDLSHSRNLHNSAIDVFVSCAEHDDSIGEFETIVLTSKEAGRAVASLRKYRRRVTRMRHLSLTGCSLLTDIACSNLAHSMPSLEFLELAGIGVELKDEGVIRLLNTTPLLRRLDLEDASAITDAVLVCLTPAAEPPSYSGPPQLGQALEHLIVSYAIELTDGAFSSLVRGCPKLRVLEADNTGISGLVLKEFVRLSRKRNLTDARIVAVDCRSVTENQIKELHASIRPRLGWRDYDTRKLQYLDARDEEGLKVGQDELDQKRVVVKTFYSWQTVDLVRTAREKKRKIRRARSEEVTDYMLAERAASRWWNSGVRRASPGAAGGIQPPVQDGCIVA